MDWVFHHVMLQILLAVPKWWKFSSLTRFSVTNNSILNILAHIYTNIFTRIYKFLEMFIIAQGNVIFYISTTMDILLLIYIANTVRKCLFLHTLEIMWIIAFQIGHKWSLLIVLIITCFCCLSRTPFYRCDIINFHNLVLSRVSNITYC